MSWGVYEAEERTCASPAGSSDYRLDTSMAICRKPRQVNAEVFFDSDVE